MQTNSQRMARAAYSTIDDRLRSLNGKEDREKYTGFAREFPTLVHSCGLAQAVAFALAKGGHQENYVSDLAVVLRSGGYSGLTSEDKRAKETRDAPVTTCSPATRGRAELDLAKETRDAPVTTYLRLSRDALSAAVWLKRYVEAMGEQPTSPGGK